MNPNSTVDWGPDIDATLRPFDNYELANIRLHCFGRPEEATVFAAIDRELARRRAERAGKPIVPKPKVVPPTREESWGWRRYADYPIREEERKRAVEDE